MHGSCAQDSPRSLRAATDQACRHLSGVIDDLQPVLVSAPLLRRKPAPYGAPNARECLSYIMGMAPLLTQRLTSPRNNAAQPSGTSKVTLTETI